MVNSTLEDLILYMFNELNSRRKARIESELQSDWVLREKYNVMQESRKRLSSMKLQSPRLQSINEILQYAKRTSDVSS